MDEQTLQLKPGFDPLRSDLRQLVERLLTLDPRYL
jgi:hypothetical protein